MSSNSITNTSKNIFEILDVTGSQDLFSLWNEAYNYKEEPNDVKTENLFERRVLEELLGLKSHIGSYNNTLRLIKSITPYTYSPDGMTDVKNSDEHKRALKFKGTDALIIRNISHGITDILKLLTINKKSKLISKQEMINYNLVQVVTPKADCVSSRQIVMDIESPELDDISVKLSLTDNIEVVCYEINDWKTKASHLLSKFLDNDMDQDTIYDSISFLKGCRPFRDGKIITIDPNVMTFAHLCFITYGDLEATDFSVQSRSWVRDHNMEQADIVVAEKTIEMLTPKNQRFIMSYNSIKSKISGKRVASENLIKMQGIEKRLIWCIFTHLIVLLPTLISLIKWVTPSSVEFSFYLIILTFVIVKIVNLIRSYLINREFVMRYITEMSNKFK